MDIAAFKLAFPQFADVPDATIEAQAVNAACFLTAHACGCEALAEQLIVAHLLALAQTATSGGTVGQVASASIDKVSVSVAAQQTRGEYAFWLGTTPYGMQLLALLRRCAVGGGYYGGRPERAAFRSVGGTFPNNGRVFRL